MGLGFPFPLGGSGPPLVAFVTPAGGTLLSTTPIVLTVTDPGGVLKWFLAVELPGGGVELAWDGTAWTSRYSAGSSATPDDPLTPTLWTVSVIRTGGWLAGATTLTGTAFDDGDLTEASQAYTFEAAAVAASAAASVATAAASDGLALDLLLDASGDLAQADDGDLALATGLDGIAQLARTSLELWLGEWWLDEEIGVDYEGQVLVKNPHMVAVRDLLRRELLAVTGIVDVLALDLAQDTTTRTLSVTFRASTDTGEISGAANVGA